MEMDFIWWRWLLESMLPVIVGGFFFTWWIAKRIEKRKANAILLSAFRECIIAVEISQHNQRRASNIETCLMAQPSWIKLEYQKVDDYYNSELFAHDKVMSDCLMRLIVTIKHVNSIIDILNTQYSILFSGNGIPNESKSLYRGVAERLSYYSAYSNESVECRSELFLKLMREHMPKQTAKRAVFTMKK